MRQGSDEAPMQPADLMLCVHYSLNALKAFVSSDNKSSGQSGQQGQQAQSGGGDMQSKLVSCSSI